MSRARKFVDTIIAAVGKVRGNLPPPADTIVDAVIGWSKDDVPRLGASLAYYTLFSIAPILLIAVAIAGMFFGAEAVRGQIVGQLQGLMGEQGAQAIQTLLEGAAKGGGLSLSIGGIALVLGSTGAFLELQHALNTVFKVKTDRDAPLKTLVLQRLKSFGLVITLGFLMLVSLAVSAGLSALSHWIHAGPPTFIWRIVDLLVSLAVITSLFALIYKFLPDADLKWRNVWIGAIVTASLLILGKFLIGLYLGRTALASSYGAIGSILILLVWVYYAAQLVLLGAEITRVYSQKNGDHPAPNKLGKRDRKARPSVRPAHAAA